MDSSSSSSSNRRDRLLLRFMPLLLSTVHLPIHLGNGQYILPPGYECKEETAIERLAEIDVFGAEVEKECENEPTRKQSTSLPSPPLSPQFHELFEFAPPARPRKRRLISNDPCVYCDEIGHFANRCPFASCFTCHELGHMSSICPLNCNAQHPINFEGASEAESARATDSPSTNFVPLPDHATRVITESMRALWIAQLEKPNSSK